MTNGNSVEQKQILELLECLGQEVINKKNTAFVRSTMRECIGVITGLTSKLSVCADGGKGDEHDSRMWDAGYSAGIDFERRRNALLADGGKGEAVYQYKVRDLSGWHDCDAGAYERITTNMPSTSLETAFFLTNSTRCS
jgi:hypothetical protein